MIDSLGLLEVYGLASGIEAADAMLKSANVRILNYEMLIPGMITLVVEGIWPPAAPRWMQARRRHRAAGR